MDDAHPDVEQLDTFLDTPDDVPAVARHVAGCGACRRELADLREVRRRLGDLRTLTPPLPDDWNTFLDRLATPPSASHDAPAAGRRSRLRSKMLIAAAAGGITAVGVPTYLAGRPETPRQHTTAMSQASTSHSGSVTVRSSGSHYTRENAGRTVRSLLAESGRGGSVADTATTGRCDLPAVARHPRLIDHGRFEGRPATVYVTRQGATITAVIVGPECHVTTLRNL